MGGRHPSEPYEVLLTIYSPEGQLVERVALGEIPPNRRRLFNVSQVMRGRYARQDHLTAIHRIPQRLLKGGRSPEDSIELIGADADYGMFRSMVQYSWPSGAHGSVIYETPHGLNTRRPGRSLSQTLTFTSKIVQSAGVNTCIALIYYSVDPGWSMSTTYSFAFFAPSGQRVASGARTLRPFGVELLDAGRLIPAEAVAQARDPADGLSCFSYIGCCQEGIVMPLILSLAPTLGAVAVEHTHPAQSYTCPANAADKNREKARAVDAWSGLLAEAGNVEGSHVGR